MKNDLEFQAMIGSLAKANLKPKIKEGLENLARELAAINDQFQVELYRVKTDDRYSAMGRDLLTQELGSSVLEKVAPYEGAYRNLIEEQEKKLFQQDQRAKSSTEILIERMDMQELRQMHGMANMDPLEMEARIDDPGFLEALLTSPKPLLPKKRLGELVRKKAENENPAIADELDHLGFADSTIKSLVNTIRADVRASGWKESDAPIEKAA